MKPALIAGGVVIAALLLVGTNVALTAMRSSKYPEYWRGRMNEPVPANAVRMVALGDSSVEAIGADRPMDGYVGRIAGYVAARTGRPVHVANVSTGGGKTRDIIADQLPSCQGST